MLSLDIVTEFMYGYFSGIKTSKNGSHFLARCVLCGDSKKSKAKRRFNLDYNNGNPIYHCFNCGRSGSFLQIYSTLKNITISEAKKELYDYNPDRLIQELSNKKRDKIIKEIEYEYYDYILKDCISITDIVDDYITKQYQKQLLYFYKDRQIPSTIRIYIAFKGDYKGRFIIPIFNEDDHIVYFQARRIRDDIELKYKNPTLEKGSIIYNKHKFDRSMYIIVFEGLIDAMMVGSQGTSCMGSEITENFVSELIGLTDKGIIIAFDNDKTGIKSLYNFMKKNIHSNRVKYFLFPCEYMNQKDINNIVVKYHIKDVYDMIIKNSYSKIETVTKLNLGVRKSENN